MRTRACAALLTVGALVVASCGGGDGGSALSEDDFRDALAKLCTDFTEDSDKVDQPQEVGDFEDFSKDLLEIFQKAKADLAELEAPDELADDFEKFQGLVDDEINELEDLQKAGEDEDEDEAGKIVDNIVDIQDDAEKVADDLGVDECKPEPSATENTDPQGSDTTAPVLTLPPTLPPETTPPSTEAPATTVPPTTLPPATLPPVTLPPGTVAPATTAAPATTIPPDTAPPDTGPIPPLFDIMDIPARFNPFPPFFLGPPSTEFENEFIQLVADDILLNLAIDEMGVAFIHDSNDDVVAIIVLGFAINQDIGMPNSWKDIFCPPDEAQLRITPDGFEGVYCDFRTDLSTELFEVFSATTSEVGLTIATLTDIDVNILVDGFLGASN